MIDVDNEFKKHRPILIVANSSWYLTHYRRLLISNLKSKNKFVITLAPLDSSSIELSKLSLFIPWKAPRLKALNIFSTLKSLLRLFFIVRTIKPSIIHSHTLKANFLVSFVSMFFGIPTVLSFAGMGELSNSKGIKKYIYTLVLLLIRINSNFVRIRTFKIEKTYKRTAFIFQNNIDLNFFRQKFDIKNNFHSICIPGSGLPEIYLDSSTSKKYLNKFDTTIVNNEIFDFIFCARLLKSKGIFNFLDTAKVFKKHNFIVFGNRDSSKFESISQKELKFYKDNYKNIIFEGNQINPLLSRNINLPILIVPSNYSEGLPRGILEALSLGIPVISTKKASCGVFDNKSIYIVDEFNLKSFDKVFKKIISNINNKTIITKLDYGYDFVARNLTEKKIVELTIQVYEKILNINSKSLISSKDSSNLINWISN